MRASFRNEPFMDFNNEWNNKLYDAALSGVEAELGQSYPLVIGGAKIHTERTANSVNPARKRQVIGVVSQADTELAEQAIQTARVPLRRGSTPSRANGHAICSRPRRSCGGASSSSPHS